jgi:hypothetical protein
MDITKKGKITVKGAELSKSRTWNERCSQHHSNTTSTPFNTTPCNKENRHCGECTPVVDDNVSNGVHPLVIDRPHQLHQLVLVAILAVQVVQLACSSSSGSKTCPHIPVPLSPATTSNATPVLHCDCSFSFDVPSAAAAAAGGGKAGYHAGQHARVIMHCYYAKLQLAHDPLQELQSSAKSANAISTQKHVTTLALQPWHKRLSSSVKPVRSSLNTLLLPTSAVQQSHCCCCCCYCCYPISHTWHVTLRWQQHCRKQRGSKHSECGTNVTQKETASCRYNSIVCLRQIIKIACFHKAQ